MSSQASRLEWLLKTETICWLLTFWTYCIFSFFRTYLVQFERESNDETIISQQIDLNKP